MTLLPFDYAARNLLRSRARLSLLLAGGTLVILLVISAAAFVRGMTRSLQASGEPDNVILLGAGSEDSIERSEIDATVAGIINASIPGIRSRDGTPYLSPEVHVQLPIRAQAGEGPAPLVLLRGVTPAATLVHPAIQIIEGRFPAPGRSELLVGVNVAMRMGVPASDLALGGTLLIDSRPWNIVGRFAAPGAVYEAEIWAPLNDLKDATRRLTDSCVIATLDPDIAELADIAAFTRMRVDLELTSLSETQYYARLADFFAPIRAVVWIAAGLIALGGLFGGLNTLYAAFTSRVREFGTLQSLGFQRHAIFLSLIQESLLATTTGAFLAGTIALVALDGVAVRFSMGTFGLIVDTYVLCVGFIAAVMLGLIGAIPPALRCLRMTIPAALRAV